MELSLRVLFQDFNASKCLVYCCLLVFTLLFALRLDEEIQAPFWLIFMPLWLWAVLAMSGAFIGCVSHCRHPPPSTDIQSELDYRTMVLCAAQHSLLFIFEMLACYKLDSENTELKWILVFVPLVFESVISIVVCIWSVRQERTFEFELFFSINVLQFVFVALKLDKMLDWTWAVIFIPLWILICLSLIGVLYAIILAVLLIRSIELLPERRRQHMWSAVGYTLLVVPLLVFLVLLTGKLDAPEPLPGVPESVTPLNAADLHPQVSFVFVCTPLYVSLACLALMTCGARSGNQWWFGMRTDFCAFLLDSVPCLQEYGNVSYKFGEHHNTAQTQPTAGDMVDGAHARMDNRRPQTLSSANNNGGGRPSSETMIEMTYRNQHQQNIAVFVPVCSRGHSRDNSHAHVRPVLYDTIEAPD